MAPNDTAKRAELTDAIATIVLQDGLEALALRGLAARLSTSGRMLLYYFGTKDALVRAVLTRISERMAVMQDATASEALQTAGDFLANMMQAGIDPATAPFMRLWTEVIARAARNEAPYRDVAGHTIRAWLNWIISRLHPSPDNEATAAAVLAIMDGITILEMARPGTTEAARRLLPALLDRS
ncbi:TetR/AcrR family transcriptional regulator [Lichenicoccus sp.]|uniref:TetR/AcrR family transcriptional regulator n=1 Tax=Lichenicoccus sp. TaxID=2781899 RepID=UPI003D1470EF